MTIRYYVKRRQVAARCYRAAEHDDINEWVMGFDGGYQLLTTKKGQVQLINFENNRVYRSVVEEGCWIVFDYDGGHVLTPRGFEALIEQEERP